MDFASNYDISRTADFIRSKNFTRVALQFPDDLLVDSTRVAKSLKNELGNSVRFFVMADTAYGSCCADEAAASHVDADCVVHYGHACMSPTSTLPALFVFGKAEIDILTIWSLASDDLHYHFNWANLDDYLAVINRVSENLTIQVLFGSEYAHALQDIKSVVADILPVDNSCTSLYYAEVACSVMNPSESKAGNEHLQSHAGFKLFKNDDIKMVPKSDQCKMEYGTRCSLGGLTGNKLVDQKMQDCLLFWIGSDDATFVNVVLTFNNCEIVRYDATESKLLNDFSLQKIILKRRYYLVEKAKDANIVGILVDTLGVAHYLHMIRQMKELIEGAGKKSCTLVMGRPNSAKLANFPECDAFVYVSCAQTALLDSKEFFAPVITPFESVLAFSSIRGKQWTEEYVMEFRDLINSASLESVNDSEEAWFSFLQGGYMEDFQPQENVVEQKESSLDLVEVTEKALDLKTQSVECILFKGTARSGAEFFAARSYQGLNMEYENTSPQSYIIGRFGKASGYAHEKNKHDKD